MLTRYFAILFLLLSIAACAPRGENKSIDEVFALQKQNFAQVAAAAQLKDPVSGNLREIAAQLERLALESEPAQVASHSKEIADAFVTLIPRAGFTSRPAMTELQSQFLAVSQDGKALDQSSRKMLAARTYSALASELETTKFNL